MSDTTGCGVVVGTASANAKGWYLTCLLSFLSLNQCSLWFTFACVDPDLVTARIPGMTLNMISLTALLGPIGYLIAFPLTTAIATYGKVGVRRCLVFSSIALTLMSALLWVATLDAVRETPVAVPLCMLALFVNALVGPTVLALPAPMTADWFPPERQGLPTSVALTSNSFGLILWFPLGPALVRSPTDLPRIMWVRTLFAVVGLLPILFYYPSPPSSPLSLDNDEKHSLVLNQNKPREDAFRQVACRELKHVFKLPAECKAVYVVVAVCAGMQTGVFGGFSDFVQDVLQKQYSSTFLGWLGFGLTLASVPGSLVGGLLHDIPYTRDRFYGLFLLCLIVELLLLIAMCCFLGIGGDAPLWKPWDWVLVINMTVIGFVSGVVLSAQLLLSLHLAPDVPQAVVGAWTSTANNAGYAVFFLFPTQFLTKWGCFIEVVFLGGICLVVAWSRISYASRKKL